MLRNGNFHGKANAKQCGRWASSLVNCTFRCLFCAITEIALLTAAAPVARAVQPGPRNRSYLGVSLEENSTKVSQVVEGGPADQAGIKAGDKIVMMGEVKIGAVADLLKTLQSAEPGAEVKVQLQRGEELVRVSVKLAAPLLSSVLQPAMPRIVCAIRLTLPQGQVVK